MISLLLAGLYASICSSRKKHSQPCHGWSMTCQSMPKPGHFFKISIHSTLGNGQNTLFWSDRWLHGKSVADLAPHLIDLIPRHLVNWRSVQQALTEHGWVHGGLVHCSTYRVPTALGFASWGSLAIGHAGSAHLGSLFVGIVLHQVGLRQAFHWKCAL